LYVLLRLYKSPLHIIYISAIFFSSQWREADIYITYNHIIISSYHYFLSSVWSYLIFGSYRYFRILQGNVLSNSNDIINGSITILRFSKKICFTVCDYILFLAPIVILGFYKETSFPIQMMSDSKFMRFFCDFPITSRYFLRHDPPSYPHLSERLLLFLCLVVSSFLHFYAVCSLRRLQTV
jgi:hypothetical protein